MASQATRSGPSIAGSGLQQVGHPPDRDDGDPVSLEHAPGDGCAVDGDHHGDLDVGDAKDLVRLVGRPQHLAQGRDEQVAAMPDHPVGVQLQPPPILLLSIISTPPGPTEVGEAAHRGAWGAIGRGFS